MGYLSRMTQWKVRIQFSMLSSWFGNSRTAFRASFNYPRIRLSSIRRLAHSCGLVYSLTLFSKLRTFLFIGMILTY